MNVEIAINIQELKKKKKKRMLSERYKSYRSLKTIRECYFFKKRVLREGKKALKKNEN